MNASGPPPGGPPGASVVEEKSRRKRHTDPSNNVADPPVATSAPRIVGAGPFPDDADVASRLAKRGAKFDHFLCKSFPQGKRPTARPLANSSNFCYLNAVTQALIFVPPFAHACALLAGEAKDAPVASMIGKFLKEGYWRGGSNALVAPRLPAVASLLSKGSGRQEDACEFLALLLGAVEKELQAIENKYAADPIESIELPTPVPVVASVGSGKKEKGWVTVGKTKKEKLVQRTDSAEVASATTGPALLSSSSCLYRQIFGGVLANMLRGGRGNSRSVTSVTFEPFSYLPVSVAFASTCTVEDALTRVFQQEVIADDARGVDMKKVSLLEQLPQTLIIQVRRWAVTAEGEVVKLDNQVVFDRPNGTRLTIPPECCAHKFTPVQRLYHLDAVVCHRGQGTEKGHYVTYLIHRQPSSSSHRPSSSSTGAGKDEHCSTAVAVVLCNDAAVSNATLRQLDQETAYLLIYSRVVQGSSSHVGL